ncbi:MAG: hypothetical protein ACOY41_02790 [Pseudomonadota bacterium]
MSLAIPTCISCFSNRSWAALLGSALFMLSITTAPARAMQELKEEDMGAVTGEGIAIVLNDISLTMSPTSYIELTGTDVAAANLLYLRGDLRWYGLSYTSSDGSNGQAWSGACVSGYLDLGCPIGGTIGDLSPHDNPLLLRAYDYNATTYDGALNQNRTVLELLFPTAHESYRFAFWGEMNIGTGTTRRGSTLGTAGPSTIGNGSNRIQMQNIWSNIRQGGTLIRLFQHSDTGDPTLGLQYWNVFKANIRMSVNQTLFSPNTLAQTPEFDSTEGLYWGDYRLFMPVGQLHYQSLILDDVPSRSGDLLISLTQIPDVANVYNTHYGRTSADDPTLGYDRAKYNTNGNWNNTHGYLRVGDFAPTQNHSLAYSVPGFGTTNAPITGNAQEVAGCMADKTGCTATPNAAASTTDGLFFASAPGETFTVYNFSPNYMFDGNIDVDTNANAIGGAYGGATSARTVINLGDANISGLMFHFLSLKTLGAGG